MVVGVGRVRSEKTDVMAEVGKPCAGGRDGTGEASEAMGQVELELARTSV